MNKRNESTISKTWAHFSCWYADNSRGEEAEALSAKEKTVELCKKYSSCDNFGKWGKSCKNCSGILFDVCSFVSAEEISKKVNEEKGKKSRVTRPFEFALQMWNEGKSKAELIALLIEKEMSEAAAKRFANDIFSVASATVGNARKKGGLIERYMFWALTGEGEEPTGCSSTLGFCKPFAKAWKVVIEKTEETTEEKPEETAEV